MVLADLTEIVKNNYNTKTKTAAFYKPTLSCAKQNTIAAAKPTACPTCTVCSMEGKIRGPKERRGDEKEKNALYGRKGAEYRTGGGAKTNKMEMVVYGFWRRSETVCRNAVRACVELRQCLSLHTYENLYSPKIHGRYRQDTDMYERQKKRTIIRNIHYNMAVARFLTITS